MNNAFRVPLRAQGGMPEYRSQSIGPQAGANVSARYDDRAAGIMLAQANRNAQADAQGWEQFNTGLQGFLKAGVGLYNDYRDKTSRAYIQEAVLRSQEEFAAWQAEYDKTHQGEQGINAAADYEQAWARISATHMKGLRDKGVSGPYEQYADLQFRQNGLHYGRQGVAFQTQQDKRWKGSLADGAYAALKNTVAANPDDHERIGAMKAQAYQAYALAHPGEDMRAFEDKVNNLVANTSIEARIAAGDFEGARRDLAVYGNAGGLNGVPTHTGQARVLAKYESGTQGSMHVSYGLPRTDGVDVGKYSFITKGGNGGSVGEFIRWAGQQGGIGKELYDKMHALTGGDWNALDSREFWKSKGGQAAWQALVKSDPAAFEQLEDGFWLPRLDSQIGKLRPEVQEAIRNDQTGALREMALSTINQHKTALRILNDNFDADPETFVKNVYKDRSSPSRFAATGDAGIGARRMRGEVRDVLAILHGGAQQNDAAGRQPEGRQSGRAGAGWLTPRQQAAYEQSIRTGMERQQKEDDARAILEMVSAASGLPQEQRLSSVYDEIDKVRDPERRARLRTLAGQELEFQKQRETAQTAMQGRALAAQVGKEAASPADMQARLLASGQPQAVIDYAQKLLFTDNKENPANRQALREALLRVDSGELPTAQDREIWGYRHGMTNEQTKKLVEYRGREAETSISDVQRVYDRLYKINRIRAEKMPGGFYEAVLQRLPRGQKPTDRDLESIVANLAMDGEFEGGVFSLGYGPDRTAFEALGDTERGPTWLPKLQEHEIPELDALLLRHHIAVTDFNRRKLKKLNAGIPDNRPWETLAPSNEEDEEAYSGEEY